MNDSDLQKLWDDQDDDAACYFSTIKPEIIAIATQQSQGVLARIEKNHRSDYWLTCAGYICIIFFFIYKGSWIAASLFLVLGTLSMTYNYTIKKRFTSELETINTKNTVLSIEQYIRLIENHSQKIIWALRVYTPIGALVAFSACFIAYDFKWEEILTLPTIGGSIIFLFFLFISLDFSYKKYVQWLWGSKIAELEEIKASLRTL